MEPSKLPVAILYVAMVILGATSILYANYAARQKTQVFCESVGVVVEAYDDPAIPDPTTEVGRKFEQSYRKLYRELGCN